MFVVTKTNIESKLTDIVSSHDDEKDALYSIKKQILDDGTIHHKNYKNYIEEYHINKGSFYTTKELKYNYQIIKVPEKINI